MYKCQNERYRERLAFLGVDCTNDVQHVHPRYFCNRCYRAAPRQHTSPGSTPITPYLWKEHTESGCQVSSYTLIQENAQVCQHFRSLQRPGRKPSAKRGRPPASGKKMLANHVHKLMPPTERPEEYDLQNCPVSEESLLCRICDAILHQPIQLGCGALVCSNCTVSWIESYPHEMVACPCCYEEILKVMLYIHVYTNITYPYHTNSQRTQRHFV